MTNVKKAMEISSRFSDDTLREIAYKVALEAMRWKDETMNAYITEAVTMLRRLDYVITTAEIRRIERQSAIWHKPIVAHGMTFKTLKDACCALRPPYDRVKYERKKRDMTGQEVINLFLARNVK